MSLKSKIEAVIYASEEPVTLQQLVGLLADEAESELQAMDSMQAELQLHHSINTQQHEQAQYAGTPADVIQDHDQPVPEPAADLAWAADTQPASTQETAPQDNETTTAAAEAQPAAPPTDPAPDLRALRERERQVRDHLHRTVATLVRDYADSDRGIEIREVAGGFRMGTKPEYHDAVRGFVKSLKPALKLTLQALETLAVVAYKQPVTAAEISEIRGVDSAGVLGGLIGRKLIATAGRKQVIGRPMLYKTTREFLVRFGLKDVHELPSMDEFERLAGELNEQEDLPMEPTDSIIERANARGDADHIRSVTADEEPSDESPESKQETQHPSASTDTAEPGGTADEQNTSPESNTETSNTEISDTEEDPNVR